MKGTTLSDVHSPARRGRRGVKRGCTRTVLSSLSVRPREQAHLNACRTPEFAGRSWQLSTHCRHETEPPQSLNERGQRVLLGLRCRLVGACRLGPRNRRYADKVSPRRPCEASELVLGHRSLQRRPFAGLLLSGLD